MLLAAAIIGLFILPEPWGWIALPVAALVEVGELYFWIRFLRRYRVTTGAEGLIGGRAEVIEPCAPTGRAKIRGEIWNARCADGAARGETLRVAAVDGLTLVLERESGG